MSNCRCNGVGLALSDLEGLRSSAHPIFGQTTPAMGIPTALQAAIALPAPPPENNRFTPTEREIRAAQVRTTGKTVNFFGAVIPIYNQNGRDVVFKNGQWFPTATLGRAVPTAATRPGRMDARPPQSLVGDPAAINALMNLTRFSNYGPTQYRLGATIQPGVTPRTAVTYGVSGWFDDLFQGIANPAQAQNTGGGLLGGTLGNILVQVTNAFASKTVLEASGARESGRYIQTPTGNIPIYVLNGVDVVYDGSKFIPATQVAKTAQQEARQSITETFSTWLVPIAVIGAGLYFAFGRKR